MGKTRKKTTKQQDEAIKLIIQKDINGMTDGKISDKVGINRSTLYDWKKKAYFNDKLLEQAEEFQRAFLSEGYNVMRQLLENGKESTQVKILDILFKTQGKYKQVSEQKITIEEKSMADMLDDIDEI